MTPPKVIIPLEGIVIRLEGVKEYRTYRFKFVVMGTQEEKYLRGEVRGLERHYDIYRRAEEEGLKGYVLGGGWIQVHPQRKRLYAFGRSEDYGSARQLVVEELLGDYCVDLGYKLNVVMDEVADEHLARKREERIKEYVTCKIGWLKEFRNNNPEAAKRELIEAKEEIKMFEEEYWNYREEYTNELKALIEEIEREDNTPR